MPCCGGALGQVLSELSEQNVFLERVASATKVGGEQGVGQLVEGKLLLVSHVDLRQPRHERGVDSDTQGLREA